MQECTETELQLLNIQVGSLIRFHRLNQKLSQLDLGLMIGTDGTMIGRVERALHNTSWQNLYRITTALNLDIAELFAPRSKIEIIDIIEKSMLLDKKLSSSKRDFFLKVIESLKV